VAAGRSQAEEAHMAGGNGCRGMLASGGVDRKVERW
jgi:hypothetical protein